MQCLPHQTKKRKKKRENHPLSGRTLLRSIVESNLPINCKIILAYMSLECPFIHGNHGQTELFQKPHQIVKKDWYVKTHLTDKTFKNNFDYLLTEGWIHHREGFYLLSNRLIGDGKGGRILTSLYDEHIDCNAVEKWMLFWFCYRISYKVKPQCQSDWLTPLPIAISIWQEESGLNKPNVIKHLNHLTEKKYLIKHQIGVTNEYSLGDIFMSDKKIEVKINHDRIVHRQSALTPEQERVFEILKRSIDSVEIDEKRRKAIALWTQVKRSRNMSILPHERKYIGSLCERECLKAIEMVMMISGEILPSRELDAKGFSIESEFDKLLNAAIRANLI